MKNKEKISPRLKNIQRLIAFTLAEVLIVLGIIGIIAQMTIPTLIKSTEKATTETQLKKIAAEINQAILRSQADGIDLPVSIADRFANEATLSNMILPYLIVTKKCESGEADCGLTNFWCLHRNDKGLSLPAAAKRYVLKDGTFIGFYNPTGNPYTVVVDVNGAKGPSVAGIDVFFLWIYPNPTKIVLFGQPTIYGQCDNEHTGSGVYCYMRFVYDGNQINYW